MARCELRQLFAHARDLLAKADYAFHSLRFMQGRFARCAGTLRNLQRGFLHGLLRGKMVLRREFGLRCGLDVHALPKCPFACLNVAKKDPDRRANRTPRQLDESFNLDIA